MVFKDEQELFSYIKLNETIPAYITVAREKSKELKALIDGDDFHEELINRIEKIESQDKAQAREKYSRDIRDLFERMSNPLSNIFSSTGGSKNYNITDESIFNQFIGTISNCRDNKSIEKFVQDVWMKVYHTDPNGIIFMEYKEDKVYPTYKSINDVRAYEYKGQLLDVLLFEPKKVDEGQLWRVVDDLRDYTVLQTGSDSFRIIEDLTFEHPFGQVPALINSDKKKIGTKLRLSPYNSIIPLTKEYARDQSIKSIYKFQQGFPLHWRYVTQCKSCTGVGKKGDKYCSDCDGKGYLMRKDVTDMVTLPVPHGDQVKLAPDIAGYITPDLETWTKYDSELDLLENIAYNTIWGTTVEGGNNETATGRFIDVQPVMNKLNEYADVAEWVEGKITEWIANFIITSKDKQEKIASISYGRRYIIESPDVILEKYNKAKESKDNSTILDRLLNEYITSKYKNDPIQLGVQLKKAVVEPFVHMDIVEVNTIYGNVKAQEKGYFNEFWNTLTPEQLLKDEGVLRSDFELWVSGKVTKQSNQLN